MTEREQERAARESPRIGVMQGRLSPRPEGKLQEFPWRSYRQEFHVAARLGFDSIEWIFEAPRYEENPLWSASGRAEIRALVQESGVAVDSVCADFFMVRKLAGESEQGVAEARQALARLIEYTREVGATRILLPLLETSAVGSLELKRQIAISLRAGAAVAEAHGVTLGLEMEVPAAEYAEVVQSAESPRVRAYYDTGNSTAQGIDIGQDVVPLLPLLHAVHVKDRVRGGGSKPLGTGDANFAEFFRVLAASGVTRDFVLQHYFEHAPEAEALASLVFVRDQLARAAEASR